jgi:hypothetical protein
VCDAGLQMGQAYKHTSKESMGQWLSGSKRSECKLKVLRMISPPKENPPAGGAPPNENDITLQRWHDRDCGKKGLAPVDLLSEWNSRMSGLF